MPYYVYRIKPGPSALVKNLSLDKSYDSFQQAKRRVRELRTQSGHESEQWKMVFAESELQAEELLQEKRDAPVLMEWEK